MSSCFPLVVVHCFSGAGARGAAGWLARALRGFSPWLVAPFLAAVGGWSLAWYARRSRGFAAVNRGEWTRTAYVLLLNKLYVDEIYDVCVVKPSIRFSKWLLYRVDVRGFDLLIRDLAGLSKDLAQWLDRTIEIQAVKEQSVKAPVDWYPCLTGCGE